MLDRLSQLDRRWIFTVLFLAVLIPMLHPLGLKITPHTPVKKTYEFIEALPEGSYALLSFDYGPGGKPECHPMAVAMIHQCFRKNMKLVCIALDPAGQALAREALNAVAPQYQKQEGIDYVNLGFKAGNEAVPVSMGLNFRNTFPVDSHGSPVDAIPVMAKVHSLSDFAFASSFSVGRPGALEHLRVTHSAYGVPLVICVTAVMVPEYYTYYSAGQAVGMLGGLRGAAEYEVLLNLNGSAQAGMGAQSVAHLTLAFFIVFSNLVYFAQRLRR